MPSLRLRNIDLYIYGSQIYILKTLKWGNVVKNKMSLKLKLLGTFVGDYFQPQMNPHL